MLLRIPPTLPGFTEEEEEDMAVLHWQVLHEASPVHRNNSNNQQRTLVHMHLPKSLDGWEFELHKQSHGDRINTKKGPFIVFQCHSEGFLQMFMTFGDGWSRGENVRPSSYLPHRGQIMFLLLDKELISSTFVANADLKGFWPLNTLSRQLVDQSRLTQQRSKSLHQ